MRNRGRLAPLTGLMGQREAEQMTAGSLPMRGGFNMTPVYGEWWSRNGRPVLESVTGDNAPVVSQLGNIQWNGILSTDYRDYIWSPDYVLDIRSDGLVNQAYAESANVGGFMFEGDPDNPDPALRQSLPWFQYGGPYSPSTPQEIFIGDLLLTGPRGSYGQCYRVIDAQNDPAYGWIAYLDRYWTSPTGVRGAAEPVDVRVIPCLRSDWGASVAHAAPTTRDITEGTKGAACLFDQLVTFDGQSNRDDFIGRRTYLVVTSADLDDPVALLLDNQAGGDQSGTTHIDTPRKNWFQNTADSYTDASNKIPHPYFCCVSNGRLIMGRAQDHQGGFDSRTIWYSAQGNMTAFHTGVQGETSSPNYVTFDQRDLNDIRGLLPLGNRFVVHRRHSQMIGSFTGTNTAPFQFAENNQDIGLEAYGAVVLAGGLHFFPTDAGPAAFDGQSVVPLGGDIRSHLVSMGFWFGEPFAVGHDRERKLIYFFTSHRRHQDCIPSPAGPNGQPPAPVSPENRVEYYSPGTLTPFYSAAPALVYSMDRQTWFFEDQPSLGALGQVREGTTWGMRLDGTVLNLKDGSVPGVGLDAAVACTSQVDPADPTELSRIEQNAEPVDAYVETPWVSFGTLERKQITKILLQIRCWGATDVYDSEDDMMHACTIEICTNGDPEVVRDTLQVQHTVKEMQDIGLDENRQPSLMLFELSPRVSGENFKFRFKNALPVGSSAKKGPMRIANVEVFYDQEESNRPLTSIGRS